MDSSAMPDVPLKIQLLDDAIIAMERYLIALVTPSDYRKSQLFPKVFLNGADAALKRQNCAGFLKQWQCCRLT